MFSNSLKLFASNIKKMESLMKENSISDVITFVPKKTLTIKYNNKELAGNDTLTPTIVQDQPEVSFDGKDGEYYTLIKTDPDAPTRSDPKWGEWRHWLVTNIPGNKVSEGDTLSQYIGAGPPPNTGLHRYIFILCKQPSKIHFKGEYRCPAVADKRNNWKAADFIKQWGLEPEGINFYQAEHDEYVPKLYAKLGAITDKPVLIE